MTIKTAVTLATGAAVGFLLGIGTSQDTREKIVSKIKGRIFYALTGERMPEKKKPTPIYRPTPASTEWKDLFEFDSREKGEEFIERARKMTDEHKHVSVSDLYFMRGKNCDFTWDRYGWASDYVYAWTVCERPDATNPKKKYWIPTPGPIYLCY